jgi:FKBP-type peptidyl-prolyl cis-trans isomerase
MECATRTASESGVQDNSHQLDVLHVSGKANHLAGLLLSLLQGSLTSGTVFDSSLDRGQPIVFTLGRAQVIRGWDQGLEGMW